MSTTDSITDLVPGRLVTVEALSGEAQQARVLETEWAPRYGQPTTRLKVRIGDAERWVTDEDLV